MARNVLAGTRCYLVGSIENAASPSSWRNLVKQTFAGSDITFFDPLTKPFVDSINEDEEYRNKLRLLRSTGQYDELSEILHKVRVEDLSLVDRSDFIIAYISIAVLTCGSWEEIFWANRMKKPTLLVLHEGKKNCPFWLFGTMPHQNIFDSLDDMLVYLHGINSGKEKIDTYKWKLFKYNYGNPAGILQ